MSFLSEFLFPVCLDTYFRFFNLEQINAFLPRGSNGISPLALCIELAHSDVCRAFEKLHWHETHTNTYRGEYRVGLTSLIYDMHVDLGAEGPPAQCPVCICVYQSVFLCLCAYVCTSGCARTSRWVRDNVSVCVHKWWCFKHVLSGLPSARHVQGSSK